MELTFFVPGMPKTAGSKRAFVNPHTKRVVVTDDNPQGKDWRASVQQFAIEAVGELAPSTDPLEVIFVFVLPRPVNHYGKLGVRPSAPARPKTRPDVLKLARAVEDALTGICWRDDAQIVDEYLHKIYSSEGRAGCQVTIRRAENLANKISEKIQGHVDPEEISRQMGLRWL